MLIFFLLRPVEALAASRRGLTIWFEQLLPALLPFSILSYIILQSNLFSGKKRRLGKIPPEEWYVIVCGFLFGFPIGSKLTADLCRQRKLSEERAQWLFILTNNFSPVFVTTVFTGLLGISPGIFTYALLYGLPFVLCMIVLHILPGSSCTSKKNTASRFQLNMQIVDAGILNGFETLIKICGYVILFSLTAECLRMMPLVHPLVKTVLIGCTEVTTGMAELSGITDSSLVYILAVWFLSWGGISGLFQTASITAGTDLSMRRYLAVRLALSGVSVLSAILYCACVLR
ncbi:MAG: hypothetical protein J1D89_05855 [Agathobacter sp.]|nr:hypothetical protein [Agathobacter sp.]